jgi:TAG lipase/steryl ester hydrolase/phospholipase A2/LPA acyltransferase
MTRLAELFNVNHFIVSQVNPHVIPFLAKEEEIVAAEAQQDAAAGPGWMSISASLCKGEILHRLQQLADTGFLPNLVTKGRSVLSQRYSGDINIFPKISYADFPRVLSNPTPDFMIGCMLTGQRATWPKLSRIQNHVAIELALDDTIQKLKGRLVFTGQEDLSLKRPSSHGNELSQRHRAKSTQKMTRFEMKTEPSSPVLRKSAPTSPQLSRATLRLPSVPKQTHLANHSKRRASELDVAAEPSIPVVVYSSNDTSDRDYFADPDSDTTEQLSSPSPPTSPTFQGPTLWPSTPQAPMRRPVSQPATPSIVDRRAGTLLNLTMTSATSATSGIPSSPELRYKRLFHPPGPATPDVSVGAPAVDSTEYFEPKSTSRPGSRRGSNAGMVFDHSGTRGMLLRKKSYM